MSLHYVIDGYNLLNHPQVNSLGKKAPDPAKTILILIRNRRLTGSAKNKIILVFDGFPKSGVLPPEETGVEVIFSRKVSADEKIKMLVEERAMRKQIIVVSDDREIKFMVKSLGAQCLGIEEFIAAKEKLKPPPRKDLLKPELNFSQVHKINEELKKIWLK